MKPSFTGQVFIYTAVYATPAQSWSGRFAVHGYGEVDGQWRFVGSFTVANGDNFA